MRTRFLVGALMVIIGSVAVAGASDENAEPNAAPNAQAKPRRSCSKENPCPCGYDCLLDPDHEKGSFCEPSLFSKMACEQAEREKLIEARRKDVKWMRPVLSASLCWYARSRAAAVKEIATEKKYAQQGGGVVDMQRMYSLQNHMREMDHATAAWTAAARPS